MTGLLHAHGSLRWIVIALMLISVVKAFQGAKRNKEYAAKDDKIFLFAMIAFHTQVLIGLLLYFMKGWYKIDGDIMANSFTRFFAVEHIFGMLLAMAVITVGRIKSKKIEDSSIRYKKIASFYLTGLIIALISIPWPFKAGFESIGWF